MKLFCNTKEITGQAKDDFIAKLVLSNNLPEDIANLGDHVKLIFTDEFVLDFAFQQVRLNHLLTADASEEEIKYWKMVDSWFVDGWPFAKPVQYVKWDYEKQLDVPVEAKCWYEEK